MVRFKTVRSRAILALVVGWLVFAAGTVILGATIGFNFGDELIVGFDGAVLGFWIWMGICVFALLILFVLNWVINWIEKGDRR